MRYALQLRPALGMPVAARPSLGLDRRRRRAPLLGQTFDELLGVPAFVGNLLRLGAHGLTSYLGLYIAVHERGWFSAAGWAVGILQGMGALVDVLALVTDIQDEIARRRADRTFEAFPGD